MSYLVEKVARAINKEGTGERHGSFGYWKIDPDKAAIAALAVVLKDQLDKAEAGDAFVLHPASFLEEYARENGIDL